MALFSMENNEEEWARLIAKDTMQDYDLLERNHFTNHEYHICKTPIFGINFWEDTDRGNVIFIIVLAESN